jgi:collagenase-like PrtC family protease
MTPRLGLGLGPLLYLWSGEEWRDFYFRIADEAPIDAVTLGEVVCSKRLHFMAPHLEEVVERLTRGGKQVRLASLDSVTLERESMATRSLAADATLPVEANDLGAVALLAGRPHVVGPFVNTYNGATARLLASRGARSICLPPELPASSIAAILGDAPGVEFELFAFGRVPLAISARCAHARSKGHSKDNCQFVCGQEPDGLKVETLDGQPFFALNGVQTVSYTCNVLMAELPEIAAMGIARLRLSPQICDMVAVARVYDDALSGRIDPAEGLARLRAIYPGIPFSNGFYHGAAGAEWHEGRTAAPARAPLHPLPG